MKVFEVVKRRAPSKSVAPPYPWMFKTKEEILEWISKNGLQMNVDRDLYVHPTNHRQDIDLSRNTFLSNSRPGREYLVNHNGDLKLPVRFHLSGDFNASNSGISYLYGMPKVVLGSVRLRNVPLKSFEGMSPVISGSIEGSSSISIKNFKGLENVAVKNLTWVPAIDSGAHIETVEFLPETLTELMIGADSLSGLNKICPDLNELFIDPTDRSSHWLSILLMKRLRSPSVNGKDNKTAVKAFQILHKHFQEDKDVLDCQEEMIKAGLKEFAKL